MGNIQYAIKYKEVKPHKLRVRSYTMFAPSDNDGDGESRRFLKLSIPSATSAKNISRRATIFYSDAELESSETSAIAESSSGADIRSTAPAALSDALKNRSAMSSVALGNSNLDGSAQMPPIRMFYGEFVTTLVCFDVKDKAPLTLKAVAMRQPPFSCATTKLGHEREFLAEHVIWTTDLGTFSRGSMNRVALRTRVVDNDKEQFQFEGVDEAQLAAALLQDEVDASRVRQTSSIDPQQKKSEHRWKQMEHVVPITEYIVDCDSGAVLWNVKIYVHLCNSGDNDADGSSPSSNAFGFEQQHSPRGDRREKKRRRHSVRPAGNASPLGLHRTNSAMLSTDNRSNAIKIGSSEPPSPSAAAAKPKTTRVPLPEPVDIEHLDVVVLEATLDGRIDDAHQLMFGDAGQCLAAERIYEARKYTSVTIGVWRSDNQRTITYAGEASGKPTDVTSTQTLAMRVPGVQTVVDISNHLHSAKSSSSWRAALRVELRRAGPNRTLIKVSGKCHFIKSVAFIGGLIRSKVESGIGDYGALVGQTLAPMMPEPAPKQSAKSTSQSNNKSKGKTKAKSKAKVGRKSAAPAKSHVQAPPSVLLAAPPLALSLPAVSADGGDSSLLSTLLALPVYAHAAIGLLLALLLYYFVLPSSSNVDTALLLERLDVIEKKLAQVLVELSKQHGKN
jgi:hypothetical protein